MEGVGKPCLAGGGDNESHLLFKVYLRYLKILVLWVQYNILDTIRRPSGGQKLSKKY